MPNLTLKSTRRLLFVYLSLFLLISFLLFLIFGSSFSHYTLPSYINPITFQLKTPLLDPLGLTSIANRQGFRERAKHGDWWSPPQELLAAEPPKPSSCSKVGPLLFIGVFTTLDNPGKRSLIRSLFKGDLQSIGGPGGGGVRVEMKFIAGNTNSDDWNYLGKKEREEFGDLVILRQEENMNDGKTFNFFEWVHENRQAPAERPQFVMKADDDTFLVLPNIIRSLLEQDCSKNVYWGTSQGAAPGYAPYFRGLGYAISWPLVDWLARLHLEPSSKVGIEDARVGNFLHFLSSAKSHDGSEEFPYKHARSKIERVDMGWSMGDWDQLDLGVEIVGAHWLKLDVWIPMIRRKIEKAWEEAGRPYRHDWDRSPHSSSSTPDPEKESPIAGDLAELDRLLLRPGDKNGRLRNDDLIEDLAVVIGKPKDDDVVKGLIKEIDEETIREKEKGLSGRRKLRLLEVKEGRRLAV